MGFVASLPGLWTEACQGLPFLSIPWPVRSFVTFALAATAFFLIDQPAVADLVFFVIVWSHPGFTALL